MTLEAPTRDDVRDLADRLGLRLSDEAIDTYSAFLAAMIDPYRRLDAMEGPAPAAPARGPAVGRTPRPDENPYNAWAWIGPIDGSGKGLLAGQSVGVKDAICVAGMPARNGSPLLEDFVPDFDATVVARILAAGGTIRGKTACENLSFSGHSHTSVPPVLNPHKTTHSAGGSSSGSAAAIAAGDVPMALGCDQGGSIRIPASWCGVVGLKPTHGLVPYTGAFAMDATIDHCGPMGARVEDVARLLTVIAGADGFDPRQDASGKPVDHYLDRLSEGRKPRRLALVKEGFGRPESEPETDRQVREAISRFRSVGVEVEEISVPAHLTCFDVWHAIVVEGTSELMFKANGLASYEEGYASAAMLEAVSGWRSRPDEISPPAIPALLMGAYMHERHHGRFYAKAQSLLARMRAEFDSVLADFDAMAMPTTPFRALAHPAPSAGLKERVELALPMVGNTAPYNAVGHPAITVPCGRHDDLPIGLMLIGRRFGEADLLSVAAMFEKL